MSASPLRIRSSQALASLRKAVALRPETAAWAPGDEDFRDFWGDPEFVLIVGS